MPVIGTAPVHPAARVTVCYCVPLSITASHSVLLRTTLYYCVPLFITAYHSLLLRTTLYYCVSCALAGAFECQLCEAAAADLRRICGVPFVCWAGAVRSVVSDVRAIRAICYGPMMWTRRRCVNVSRLNWRGRSCLHRPLSSSRFVCYISIYIYIYICMSISIYVSYVYVSTYLYICISVFLYLYNSIIL